MKRKRRVITQGEYQKENNEKKKLRGRFEGCNKGFNEEIEEKSQRPSRTKFFFLFFLFSIYLWECI